MNNSGDWRDAFCGRKRELEALLARYEEVAAGNGPRLAVVLGDRGMGKTRLVQELYRFLVLRHDQHGYWPNPSLFSRNNLRVAPELSDEVVREHFQGFKLAERPMPFLWWGFRLSDPDVRNAARSDMATHRATLDPHLAPLRFARKVSATRKRLKEVGLDVATDIGKGLLKGLITAIPGVAAVATVVDLAVDHAGKGLNLAGAARDELKLREARRTQTVLDSDAAMSEDIHDRTLSDLAAMLSGPSGEDHPIPVVVFCDDAQFACQSGDEGAYHFLTTLWQRAHLADWPLLLVLTHWSVEWSRAGDPSSGGLSCATDLRRDAASAQFGLIIELPREPELAALVGAGLPDMPSHDVEFLLRKADGNPQVLIELIELVRRSPAWRPTGDGRLTPHALRDIERRPTRLAELIRERLESDVTPESVRQAAALSSIQGMEFLTWLTQTAAEKFALRDIAEGLTKAEYPHRLLVEVATGVSGFVQRAYREAALELVGNHVGVPEHVEQALLTAAIDVVESAERWKELTLHEQTATWGTLVNLAEGHDDPDVRHYAGSGLLQLVQTSLYGEHGPNHARAAELAMRFQAGLGKRWSIEAFSPTAVLPAISAISEWHGPAQTSAVALQLLEHARALLAADETSDAARTIGTLLDIVGEAAYAAGDIENAEARYREGLRIRRLVCDQHDAPEARRELAMALDRVGDAVRVQHGWPAAEDLLVESLDIRIELCSSAETPQAREDMTLSLERLANVWQAKGEWDRAREYLQESLDTRRSLVASATPYGMIRTQQNVAMALFQLGTLEQAQERWPVAETLVRESLSIRREIASRIGTPEAMRDVVLSLNKLGNIARRSEDWTKSELCFQECLERTRELATKLGTSRAMRDLGVSLFTLGELAQQRGDAVGACKYLCEARLIIEDLARGPGNTQSASDVDDLRRALAETQCQC